MTVPSADSAALLTSLPPTHFTLTQQVTLTVFLSVILWTLLPLWHPAGHFWTPISFSLRVTQGYIEFVPFLFFWSLLDFCCSVKCQSGDAAERLDWLTALVPSFISPSVHVSFSLIKHHLLGGRCGGEGVRWWWGRQRVGRLLVRDLVRDFVRKCQTILSMKLSHVRKTPPPPPTHTHTVLVCGYYRFNR